MPPPLPDRPSERDAARRRDRALRRVSHVNRWLVGGSIALTVVLAEVAAHAFPGRTTASAATPPAAQSSGPATSDAGVPGASSAPSELQPPSAAPTTAQAPSAPSGPVLSGGS